MSRQNPSKLRKKAKKSWRKAIWLEPLVRNFRLTIPRTIRIIRPFLFALRSANKMKEWPGTTMCRKRSARHCGKDGNGWPSGVSIANRGERESTCATKIGRRCWRPLQGVAGADVAGVRSAGSISSMRWLDRPRRRGARKLPSQDGSRFLLAVIERCPHPTAPSNIKITERTQFLRARNGSAGAIS